ncbi:MAG: hypothetical protein ABR583_13135 [Gaiellaceae bacterium]
MGLVAKIRKALTGEPEDPVEKAEWLAEQARIREEKAEAKAQAAANLPGWKPPK